MPRRTDIKRVLVIGSGPIVIGQACEFDYSGTQACKALRAEGLEVVLVNSNPATIMTDPELADQTYVEPLTPEVVEAIIAKEKPDAVRGLIGRVPVFGICLGHQILGLAAGGRTYKLPFGHHGANHPVKDLATGKVEITSQNHGFAVDPKSLVGRGWEATHRNLNDETCEGLRHVELPVFSVQYHPEASPGPHDADYLFQQFLDAMEKR